MHRKNQVNQKKNRKQKKNDYHASKHWFWRIFHRKEADMKYVVTALEMQTADRNTIETIGMPQLVLMERAALESKRILIETYGDNVLKSVPVLIVIGCGNNGGDGAALARLLHLYGCNVTILASPEKDRYSDALHTQMNCLHFYNIKTVYELKEIQNIPYGIIIDALFGIGISRDLSEEHQAMLNYLNCQNSRKIALDIPSGVGNDGKIYKAAFRADITISFGFYKTGQLLYPGKQYCGEVIVADIGIDEHSFLNDIPKGITYPKETLPQDIFPKRIANSHKGTYGKVLLYAGSKNTPGAAVLAAKSVLRSGAGMLKVITCKEQTDSMLSILPEAMFAQPDSLDVQAELKWCDQMVIGPGIGTGEDAKTMFEKLLCQDIACPLVIDADGLNLMAIDQTLFEKVMLYGQKMPVILTPHLTEFARLLQTDTKEVLEKRKTLLEEFCKKTGFIIVLKDAATMVGMYNEDFRYYINQSGNDGMATAGSGDVLSGILGAVLANLKEKTKENCFHAVTRGVYLHGMAGDFAALHKSKSSMLAGDIIEELPNLLKGI